MEVIEQRIRDLLNEYAPLEYINEYIDDIFAYSSFEDYVGITDDAILKDFTEWMDWR